MCFHWGDEHLLECTDLYLADSVRVMTDLITCHAIVFKGFRNDTRLSLTNTDRISSLACMRDIPAPVVVALGNITCAEADVAQVADWCVATRMNVA